MAPSTWQMLTGNLAVVALFVLLGSRSNYWLKPLPRTYRDVVFGGIMGMGAIASMMMAIQTSSGVFFDLRYSLLAVAALFGGWPAALISGLIAMAYRSSLGGAGLSTGLMGIGLASMAGVSINALVGQSSYKAWHVGTLAVVNGVLMTLVSLSLPGTLIAEVGRALLPAIVLNMTTTAFAGMAYLHAWRLHADRELMAAALHHAPDLAYVKDRYGKFAAANHAITRMFGLDDARQLRGKDNYHVETFERAQEQLESEHLIMVTGKPMLDAEEQVTDASGALHWYSTTKVPLHDPSGDVIGLAGVSRDITASKQMQQELLLSRDTLSYALSEMTGGIAMFDSTGRLVLCNEQYRDAFPLTGSMRQPGVMYRDILQTVIESGEQLAAPQHVAGASAWVEQELANLQRESEVETQLNNGSWLQIRTRPTSNGTTMVVVIDVTRFKQAEEDLHVTTSQLKHLVRTDAITGLLNRRAFDDAIEAEIRRTSRAGTPLSLLLIDVDRFKLYNDHYGHLAGDEALRQVSLLLKSSLKRPADVVARFGGEEFTAILPDTDEDGAYLVAESIRRALVEARLPHEGSDKGYITVSVGVATYVADVVERSAVDLIETADSALYSAKAAGRDRVFGTRVPDKSRLRARS